MTRSLPTSPRLRFGSFELDPPSGQLRKDSILIRLQPQPFRLLQLLAERAGKAVSREEIRIHLWADSTFVDFEHGINFSINQIRAALSDDAEKPRYIETLPRRGYRFLAAVEKVPGLESSPASGESVDHFPAFDTATFQFQLPSVGSGAVSPSQSTIEPTPPPPTSTSPPKSRWRRFLIAAAVVVCSLAGFLAHRLAFPPAPRVLRIEQLTQSGRVDTWGRIVSDGSRLFYLEREGDHWVAMQTAGGESQPFPVPFLNTKIFAISPDASRLLLAPFTTKGGNLPLWAMPLVGGSPRRLADLLASDVTFSPNGKQLALTTPEGIFLADADGSNLHRTADIPGENGYLAWSPDGSLLRFTHAEPTLTGSLLFEVTPDGHNLHLLFPSSNEFASACCGRWTPDGSYFVFTAMRNNQSDLWALKEPRFGLSWPRPKPARLTSGPFSYVDALPANHGHLLYAFGETELLDVLGVDPKTSLTKQFLPGSGAREVDFSPDGRWLLYTTVDGLWRSRPDGSERLQLANNAPRLSIHDPRWRPDSRFILFFEQPETGREQIFVVPADGGAPRAILDADHLRDRPDWSPDGKSIVFSILDEPPPGGVPDNGIYFFDLENGRTTKVPDSSGLFEVRWSPDGHYLAAVSTTFDVLKLYDIARARWTVVTQAKRLTLPVWSSDARYVYFQDMLEPSESLSRFRPQDSVIETVFNFDALLKTGAIRCAFLGFAPDGSFLVRTSSRGGNLYKLELELP